MPARPAANGRPAPGSRAFLPKNASDGFRPGHKPGRLIDTRDDPDSFGLELCFKHRFSLGKDSVAKAPPVTVPSVKGRTKKDSLALVKAIKADYQPDWPVKRPSTSRLDPAGASNHRLLWQSAVKKDGDTRRAATGADAGEARQGDRSRQKADPSTPVQPACTSFAVVAQGAPGRDGKYRLRMTDSLVEKVASWAATRNALLFLAVQVAQQLLQEELPRLIPFLKRPNVHLGLDPEFSMKPRLDRKSGETVKPKPGARIGTMSHEDVNYAIGMLADLVTQNNLPPKVLVIHRFTHDMLTGSKKIKLDPRVQVVSHGGWGQPWLKYDSYRDYVESDPVVTRLQDLYKNDTKKGDRLSLRAKPCC